MQLARRSRSSYVHWPLTQEAAALDEPALRVVSIMSRDVFTCRASDSLNVAAQIMWDHDCGCVPVVDEAARVVGMVTDRDVCMAAYMQGKPLSELAVASACSHPVYTCQLDDLVSEAERILARAQVRRLPVVDAEGVLVGILTLSDLARHLSSARSPDAGTDSLRRVTSLLEAVSRPRLASSHGLESATREDRECIAQFDTP